MLQIKLPSKIKLFRQFNSLLCNSGVAIGTAILLSSCTAYQYIPSHHYVNVHKKKGEVLVNVNTFPAGLQAGYSITDNLYIFGTGYSKQYNRKPYRQKEGNIYEAHAGSSSEANLGIGYNVKKGKTRVGIMAGGGSGSMNYNHEVDVSTDTYNFSVEARKNNFFIEPLFGLIVNENIELGVFTRVNSVHYFHLTPEATRSINLQEADQAFLDRSTLDIMFLEPGLFFNVGWPNVKFNFQVGGSDEIRGLNIRNQSRIFRSGLSFKIGRDKKK